MQRAELQLAVDATEERRVALQQTVAQLEAENAKLQTSMTAAGRVVLSQRAASVTPATPPPSLPPQPFPVDVEDLQLVKRGNALEVRFKLRNQSSARQQGHLGIFLLPSQESAKQIAFQPKTTDTYSIRNFKNVSARYPKWDADAVVRVVAWNNDKQPVMDRTFPLPSSN